ncbi:MAG: tyrosine-type recombinase/integrase, partial [Cyanobacteria bacterium P01_F01_bin.3]
STGMRISEVIGIRVKDLQENCTQLWVGESLSRGVRKSTKNYKARTIKLTPRLTELFNARINNADGPEDLVFKSPEGCVIDDGNFRNRAWVTCLKNAGVAYRKPYITRSSFISNALITMHPTTVAQITGHNLKTLYRDYAGYIESSPGLPEMF